MSISDQRPNFKLVTLIVVPGLLARVGLQRPEARLGVDLRPHRFEISLAGWS
jgi:hypothetical protein